MTAASIKDGSVPQQPPKTSIPLSAIDRMDEEHLAKIKDVFELMEFYTAKKDQEKINDLNILYHETIYQATQSQYFEQLLKDVHYYVSVTSRHSITQPQ